MRLSIKTKQVLGVTSTVGAVVVALSLYHLAALARVSLQESKARGTLLANAIYQRGDALLKQSPDALVTFPNDSGMKSILESSIYSPDVTDAVVVDEKGMVVAGWDPAKVGKPVRQRVLIDELLTLNGLQQLWAIFTDRGRELEVRGPAFPERGAHQFRGVIGISTLLINKEMRGEQARALKTIAMALLAATLMAMLLAQLFLRPIHVLKSGLTRLQRGETGITFDLPKDEFGDLGTFFSAVSAKLSADRTELAGQKASLESMVDRLEDAIAMFDGRGELLFANPTMRELLPATSGDEQATPWHELVRTTVATRQSHGPVSVTLEERPHDSDGSRHAGEWLLMTHAIHGADGRLVGVMLIGRNLGYLSEVQSTLRYSQKLTALGRLSAGVAHEVKNPLNAMMIHLELLRQKLSGAATRAVAAAPSGGPTTLRLGAAATGTVDVPTALEHVNVIANEIKRLDTVLQGFLKFSRPEDLRLQPVNVRALFEEVADVVRAEAEKSGLTVEIDCPAALPDINADPGMLRQALLNLAINATQAMPNGGMLRFRAYAVRKRRVELVVEDTGVGIKPEHLGRIFDLYFTTREKGSGIGLSMVYRTVQLHDGDIEVQSTPSVGTAFKLTLPQA